MAGIALFSMFGLLIWYAFDTENFVKEMEETKMEKNEEL